MSSAFEKHASPMDELLAMQQSALQANLNKAPNIQKAVTLTEANWMGLTQAMELTGNSILKAQETLERLPTTQEMNTLLAEQAGNLTAAHTEAVQQIQKTVQALLETSRENLQWMQEEMQEKILRNIAKNGKLSTEDLAAMLAASPEEIEKEMNAMEEQGIICGYPTLINWDKTGCEHVTALIEVTVAPERGRGFDKVAERIYQFDEVESLYLMSGSGFDLTVIIVGKTMKEVAWFVATKLAPMESVMSTATHFVLKKYKEHGLSLVAEERGDERQLITP